MHIGNKRAFTLIELLIVIALITLLAALLFPTLSSARRKADETQCLSNMRQITLGAQLYAEDHEETLPLAMEVIGDAPSNINYWAVDNFQEALNPYIRTGRGIINRQSVWYDPADPDRNEPNMWGSFLVNGFLSAMPRRMSEVTRPDHTIYATLRREGWAKLTGVGALAATPPREDPNNPFWQSRYFVMSLELWGAPSSDYDWRNGKAETPCFIARPNVPPGGDPNRDYCTKWDRYVSSARYSARTPMVYLDGHAKSITLAQTYLDVDDDMWSSAQN